MNLPIHVRALLSLLSGGAPPTLQEDDWRELLAFSDRTQCTLFLRPHPGMPDWFHEAVEQRRKSNSLRRSRLKEDYCRVAESLRKHGIDFVLLKGFTHEVGFGIAGDDRVQYDLDLLFRPEDCAAARQALTGMGYAPNGSRDLSEVHERPLVRPSPWTWRGDYYDADMPIAVELHGRLWSGKSDRLPLPEAEQFFARRTILDVAGMQVPALAECDRVALAALHVLRHALHNNIRISHVLELARLLQHRQQDAVLWAAWRNIHCPRSLLLQMMALCFAAEWFGTLLPESGVALPDPVREWFERFPYAPLENLLRPNKNILWLHKELVEGDGQRLALVAGALLPLKIPERGRMLERILYHARAFAPALAGRWRLRNTPSNASQTSDR